jgi:hypothetical protein
VTLNTSSQEAFKTVLRAIASDAFVSESALDAEFVRSLLAFGSETDDNRSCVDRVGIRRLHRTGEPDAVGLALRSKPVLVSEIVNLAEGSVVPAFLRKAIPDIQQEDWDAALRVATLILLSLEGTIGDDG